MEELITTEKAYIAAIDLKNHAEDRRDEINKYYSSLFAAIVTIMPFIGKIEEVIKLPFFSRNSINLIVIILSIIGLTLSISWVKVLKHIHTYIIALENFIIEIEQTQNNKLFTHLTKFFRDSETSSKITKDEIWVPYIFMLIFIIILLLSLVNYS